MWNFTVLSHAEDIVSLYRRRISENQKEESKDDNIHALKMPKCEIFDRSDFHDFYTIKSLLGVGDFGVKTLIRYLNFVVS